MDKCPYTHYSCIFKALSNSTRLKIFALITSEEVCGCQLLEEVHITQPTLSYHMRILCECGLVNARKDGNWMRYTLNQENLAKLEAFLSSIKSPADAHLK